MSDLVTGFLFLCASRASLFPMKSDTWYYVFNETWSFYELWGFPPCNDEVCHAAELPYVFNMGDLTVYDYTPQEKVMAERMGFYWTNFAKYGNPNGPETSGDARLGQITDGSLVDAVYWPKFKESAEGNYSALQITAEGDVMMTDPYKELCDFMDEVDSYADH